MMTPTITIAALGPDDAQSLTLGAMRVMREAEHLILRTARHGAAQWLREEGIPFETLDALYERCEDFDELCAQAVPLLLAQEGLCYAVSEPGNDATVHALCCAAKGHCAVRVVGGVSLADQAAAAVLPYGVNTENLRVVTALSTPSLRPAADCPQVITELDNRYLASDVKLWLCDLFEDDMTVYFLPNAAQGEVLPILLCELDRQAHYDHRTAVLLPRVSVYERTRADYEDLVQVVQRLREPGGCPWDGAQTHHTLRQYMIEEACEAAEAMDGEEPMKLADELGDVLLQVVLNSVIGAQHRDFTDRDVTSLITRKMITRHAHVFGQEYAQNAQEVTAVWERAKTRERGDQTALMRVLDVPLSLPALMRAQKVITRQARAKNQKIGFDESLAAMCEAAGKLASSKAPDETALGDLLESCCALAQGLGLDAETALRAATVRRIESIRTLEEKSEKSNEI